MLSSTTDAWRMVAVLSLTMNTWRVLDLLSSTIDTWRVLAPPPPVVGTRCMVASCWSTIEASCRAGATGNAHAAATLSVALDTAPPGSAFVAA